MSFCIPSFGEVVSYHLALGILGNLGHMVLYNFGNLRHLVLGHFGNVCHHVGAMLET